MNNTVDVPLNYVVRLIRKKDDLVHTIYALIYET